MGKHLEQSSSPVHIRNNKSTSQGCMWGALHLLKYQRWSHVKKRLPHKRCVHRKNGAEDANPGVHNVNILEEEEISQQDNAGNESPKENEPPEGNDPPKVDEKIKQTSTTAGPSSKVSVKAKLKKLISDELCRKKRRHQRSRSNLAPKNDHKPLSDAAAETLNNDSSVQSPKPVDENTTISPKSSDDPSVASSSEEKSCKDSANQLPSVEIAHENDGSSPPAENENQELDHAMEPDMDALSQKAKEILDDALEMINMNKEFLVKILHDPGSPLAQHFHNQQALSSKGEYSISRSLSSRNSSSGLKKLNQKQELVESEEVKSESKSKKYSRSRSMPSSVAVEHKIDKILKQNQSKSETFDASLSGLTQHEKNPAARRFKDLKHKIKYAIKTSKNDKYRILKDAIFHKIPHGQSQRVPKDFKSQPPKKPNSIGKEGDCCLLPSGKFQRTASLVGSLDKYCQLYDCTFNREAKHNSESSKSETEDAPKTITRRFSSPDLKSQFPYGHDCSGTFLSSQVKSDIQQSLDGETNSVHEVQLETTQVSDSDQSAKASLIGDDFGKLAFIDRTFQNDEGTTLPSKSFIEFIEPNIFLSSKSHPQQDTVSPASFSIAEGKDSEPTISPPPSPHEVDSSEEEVAEEAETISKYTPTVAETEIALELDLPGNLVEFQVNEKERAEFDYVKDILKLSGFSGTELLGTWHANDQPVDPGLFEEIEEGCILLDPECSGNEKGHYCNHLLLFDLINEVLMEIYEKSYTYCPFPLSILSQVRPMPVGYHVLEQVWRHISWYLSSTPETEHFLNYIVSRDLARPDGWMNLQFDSECIGIEVEDLIFDELLDELVFDDLAYA